MARYGIKHSAPHPFLGVNLGDIIRSERRILMGSSRFLLTAIGSAKICKDEEVNDWLVKCPNSTTRSSRCRLLRLLGCLEQHH